MPPKLPRSLARVPARSRAPHYYYLLGTFAAVLSVVVSAWAYWLAGFDASRRASLLGRVGSSGNSFVQSFSSSGKVKSAAIMANLNISVPPLRLNDGTSIPLLGYGTGTAWYKTGDESTIDKALVESLKTAIRMGYYHLDGAEVYKTEPELGIAIKEGGIERSKLFVTTKVNQNVDDIPAALKASLKKLQLDYVDLYLIHQPFFAEGDEAKLQKAWKEMEAVKEAGLAKSIGVSNYLSDDIEKTVKGAKVIPSVNQIEFHPYLQHPALLETHKKYGIATAAYGPLTAVTKAAPGPLDDLYASLAKKYAVSPGEIALRWAIDQDIIAITTSSKEQRMSDYLRATTFKLNPAEIRQIKELGETKHFRGFWSHKFDKDDRS